MADPVGCTRAGTLLSRAASLLNDAAYERWTQVNLLDYMTEGLRTAYAQRPDSSIERRVISLKPGSAQKVPQDISRLLSVDLNVSRLPDGTVVELETINTQTQGSMRLAAAVMPPIGCDMYGDFNCAVYRTTAAYIDGTDPRTFYVTPNVPPGCAPEISITVVSALSLVALQADTCIYVKPEMEAALVEWTLYRAFGVDSESQFSYTASQTHLRSFYTLLDNGYRAVARINADMHQGMSVPSSPVIRYAPQRVRPAS